MELSDVQPCLKFSGTEQDHSVQYIYSPVRVVHSRYFVEPSRSHRGRVGPFVYVVFRVRSAKQGEHFILYHLKNVLSC